MDASQIPLSLSSLPLCLAPHSFGFLAQHENALRRRILKKSQQARQIFTLSPPMQRLHSPLKSPRRSVAGRSESLRFFGAFFSSLWQLTAKKKKKGTAHIPAIFSSPAQQRHSVAVGVSLCARVCLLARVSSRACVYVCLFLFFYPPSLFNSLFVYYRLQRGAVIQFCNHHTGRGGGSNRRGFFGWLPSETHAPPAPFAHTHPSTLQCHNKHIKANVSLQIPKSAAHLWLR